MNKDSKKYYKDIKLIFPVRGAMEKELLSSIRSKIDSLEDSNLSYGELCEQIGTPQEIAAEYFASASPDYLVREFRLSRRIRRILAVLMAIFILLGAIRCYELYCRYLDVMDSRAVYYIDTIE